MVDGVIWSCSVLKIYATAIAQSTSDRWSQLDICEMCEALKI